MTSIGYHNPISSGCGSSPGFSMILGLGGKPVRGGGIRGFIAKEVQDTYNESNYSTTRFTLREAWNTDYISGKDADKRIITPFRAVNNAGDILSRKYYSCGGPTQTFQSRPGLNGLRGRFGAITSNCDGSDIPPAACNVKYVYDSSDYVRFLKQQAVNRNYNDYSNGGNENSGSQSAYRAIRRY
tara:strand:+ start:82 stop:633 length:552 start_codon:yes stop_codon:yes gene_type:complete